MITRRQPDPAPRQQTTSPARDRLVQTAVARIRRDGMTVSLDHISLEHVITESGVSRATAYRAWPSKADFLREVLVTVVRSTRLEGESSEQVRDLVGLVWSRRDDLATAGGRRTLVVEALRRSSKEDFARVLHSPAWQTYLAMVATVRGIEDPVLREAVQLELARTESAFTERRAHVYARLATMTGYQLVPPLAGREGFLTMASAAGATMTGLVIAATARPEIVTETTDLAMYGATETAPWTRPALHLVGTLLQHIEPDPSVRWGAAMRRTAVQAMREAIDELYALGNLS